MSVARPITTNHHCTALWGSASPTNTLSDLGCRGCTPSCLAVDKGCECDCTRRCLQDTVEADLSGVVAHSSLWGQRNTTMCETIWRKSYLGGRAKGAEDAAGKVFLAGHRPVVASGDGHWLYDARGWPDPGNHDWLQEKSHQPSGHGWFRELSQLTNPNKSGGGFIPPPPPSFDLSTEAPCVPYRLFFASSRRKRPQDVV